jgi:hypothetical protein
MIGGTGDIMNAIGATTGVDISSLTSLSASISDVNDFNSTFYSNNLNVAMAKIQSSIDDFSSGKIPDIADPLSILVL